MTTLASNSSSRVSVPMARHFSTKTTVEPTRLGFANDTGHHMLLGVLDPTWRPEMVAQQARDELAAAAARIGVTVGELRTTYRIPLASESDNAAVREAVAKLVLEILDEAALSDEIEITLNGTSLSPELVDQACAPTVVYAV